MTPDDTSAAAQGTFGPAVARVEHALEVAERGLVRRLGARAVRALRIALKITVVTLLLLYFAFGALLLATRYWLMPRIDDVRPALERAVSRTTGMRVTIGRIEAGWHGVNPHLKLADVHVRDRQDRTGLYFPQLDATLSWASVPAWRPQFEALSIHAPELEIQRLAGGKLSIAGVVIDPQSPPAGENTLADWILEQDRLEVRDARIRYIDATAGADATPLELEDVQIVLRNGWGRHRFALNARPPSALASRFDVRASFWHPWLERAADWRLWSGRAFAQMDYVDLAALDKLVSGLPATMRVERAQGAVRTWLDFRAQRERQPSESEAQVGADRIVRFVADVALADVHTQLGRGLEPLELTAVRGRITHEAWGTPNDGGHELRLVNFDLATVGGHKLPPTSLRLRTTSAASGHAGRGEFEADRLSIDLLAHLSQQVPLAAEIRRVIASHALRGDLLAPRATWEGDLEKPARYALRARFERLGAQGQAPEPQFSPDGNPRAGFPGFENLTGSIELTEAGGTLQINGRDAALVLPGVFDQPRLPFDRLQADVRWSAQPAAAGSAGRRLDVRLDSLTVANADLELVASGTWNSGGRKVSPDAIGPGIVDLQGRISRIDVATAHRYIPRLIGPGTRAWLRAALDGGQGSEGSFRVRGDLWDFPFSDPKSGDFRASLRVRNATVDYVPEEVLQATDGARSRGPTWPAFSGVDATVTFERNRLSIAGSQASVFGLRLSKINVGIAELGAATSTLTATTELAGPLQDMLRYVVRSPVNEMIGGFLARAQGSGNARGDLKLEIPLADMRGTKVAGSVQLQNNDLVLTANIPPFTRASGRVDYTERGVTITNTTAGFVGGQSRFDAATAADGTITIQAQGTATPVGVRRTVDVGVVHRLLDRSQGTTRYTGTLTIRRGPAAGATELLIESDLSGWNIDAPAPARKAAGEALPLRIEIVPDANAPLRRDRLAITAGTVLAARLDRVRDTPDSDARIARGVIAVGEEPALPQEGLLLVANLARVDLDRWSALLQGPGTDKPVLNATAPGTAQAAAQSLPDFVSLRAREVLFSGKPIANVVLGATRLQENGVDYWQANVVSDHASGSLTWRPNDMSAGAGNAGRLSARFAQLVIPDAQNTQVVDALEAPAKDMPAIDVVAESFEIGGRKLGRLELSAQNVGSSGTWELQRLALINPEARMTAQGRWDRDAGAGPGAPRRMSMGLNVEFDNAGALLTRLGFTDALRNGTGKLEGEISWRGSPFSIDYRSLSGTLTLVTDKGQFLRAEPGVARLLGVMSLQSLPRRVTLDFRDVFSEGFAFDSIRASADIKSGVLQTRDFRMRGVSATVLIEGSLDLRSETQDLHVLVLPEINAGSASLVYALLANPAIGLGTFVAQLFLRDPLSKAFSYEYDVSGSWSEPQVRRRATKTPAPSNQMP